MLEKRRGTIAGLELSEKDESLNAPRADLYLGQQGGCDRSGAFRVIYLAGLADRVVVLHAFQKKTQRTTKRELDLAAKRLHDVRKD